MLIALGITGIVVILITAIVGLSIWVMKASDPCRHSYERVDDGTDKWIVLVCRRCGKVKKVRRD